MVGLPMLCPRLPTIAAWEGRATMTLCASGGLPCDVGSPLSDGSGLGGRGPDDPLCLRRAAMRCAVSVVDSTLFRSVESTTVGDKVSEKIMKIK